MMLRKVWDGIADGFRGQQLGKQRSISDRVAYCFGLLIGWALWVACCVLLVIAGSYLFKTPGFASGFNEIFPRLLIVMLGIAVIWAITLFIGDWLIPWIGGKTKKDPNPQESIGMAARLGDVLYWAGTLVACLIAALIAYAVLFGTGIEPFFQGLALFVAAVIWLIGRAARYVLAGR